MNYNQYQTPMMGYSGGYRMPQYPQWNQTQTNSQQVRPVSSIEEVKASPIDFDGSVFYFTDAANKKIYTKQINPDGTVAINLYELKTDLAVDTPLYVTHEEFNEKINQLYSYLKPNEEVVQQPTAQQKKKPIFEI